MRTTKKDEDALIIAWAIVLYPIAVLTTKVIEVVLGYSLDVFVFLIAALALDIFVILYIFSLGIICEEFNKKG